MGIFNLRVDMRARETRFLRQFFYRGISNREKDSDDPNTQTYVRELFLDNRYG